MSDDALTMRGPVHGTKDAKRVAIGSGVGAVIETYDFIGFGTAAALYFGTAFFPNSSPLAGTLLSFATLGVGFVARPLGGIIGGHLGDKVGRKPVLVASLILMGLATFAIGLLPTYETVGVLAPILLVTVRIIQGLAFGAEWGGAILMSYEHAPWKKKGRYTGIVQAGFPVGLLIANLVFFVSIHLGGDWAWRVPFLASIVLVIVGLIIRAKVPESPVFDDVKEQGDIVKSPIVEVVKNDWRNILRGIGLRIAETAGYAVSITYMLSYLKGADLATRSETIGALCIAAGDRHLRHLRLGETHRQDRPSPAVPLGVRAGHPVRRADVRHGEHRAVHPDPRDVRHRLLRVPERARRLPGRVVPRTVQREHPLLGCLAGLPDLGHRFRIHPLHHHAAVRGLRVVGAGPAVQRVHGHRSGRRDPHPRNLGCAGAPAGRQGCRRTPPIRMGCPSDAYATKCAKPPIACAITP